MPALEKNVLSSVGVSVQWMNSSRHDWLIMTKENLAFIIQAFCMPYSLLVGCSYARLFSWSFTPNDHTHSAVITKKKVNTKILGTYVLDLKVDKVSNVLSIKTMADVCYETLQKNNSKR